jgi:hypothetical protein
LAVIDPQQEKASNPFGALRENLASALLGNRQGLTIIGPANIVKEIKKDPKKIELLTQDAKSKSKKKR